MRYFVLVYNQATGEVVEELPFEEAERASALRARFEREKRYSHEPHIEIVVLGAASREDLERTHARYFKRPGELLAR